MGALVFVTLAPEATGAVVLVGVGVAEALADEVGVGAPSVGDAVGAAVGRSEAVGVGVGLVESAVLGWGLAAPRLKPVSAAWPSDQDVASTPRLITPTMFFVNFLTRRTPLSECCLPGFRPCAQT